MIKLSEEDLAILHQVINIARESGEELETVEEAHQLLLRIERELQERGLVDIKVVSDLAYGR